jgi:type II secretory pathway pseudopilin PulG
VIGIIAVLAAIIVPVFSRAQEKARQADCLSHLHAIAMAVKLYHMDEKAYPPPDLDLAGANGAAVGTLTQKGGLLALEKNGQISNSKALWCKDDIIKGDMLVKSGSYYMFDAGVAPAVNVKMLYNWAGYDAEGYDDGSITPPGLYQLSNPNCMDETIITHCPNHRQFWSEGSQQMDAVVRVGGDAEMVRNAAMTSIDGWRNQGKQP